MVDSTEGLEELEVLTNVLDFLPVQLVQQGFGDTCVSGKSYQLWVV